jgi:hypothetical protein
MKAFEPYVACLRDEKNLEIGDEVYAQTDLRGDDRSLHHCMHAFSTAFGFAKEVLRSDKFVPAAIDVAVASESRGLMFKSKFEYDVTLISHYMNEKDEVTWYLLADVHGSRGEVPGNYALTFSSPELQPGQAGPEWDKPFLVLNTGPLLVLRVGDLSHKMRFKVVFAGRECVLFTSSQGSQVAPNQIVTFTNVVCTFGRSRNQISMRKFSGAVGEKQGERVNLAGKLTNVLPPTEDENFCVVAAVVHTGLPCVFLCGGRYLQIDSVPAHYQLVAGSVGVLEGNAAGNALVRITNWTPSNLPQVANQLLAANEPNRERELPPFTKFTVRRRPFINDTVEAARQDRPAVLRCRLCLTDAGANFATDLYATLIAPDGGCGLVRPCHPFCEHGTTTAAPRWQFGRGFAGTSTADLQHVNLSATWLCLSLMMFAEL